MVFYKITGTKKNKTPFEGLHVTCLLLSRWIKHVKNNLTTTP